MKVNIAYVDSIIKIWTYYMNFMSIAHKFAYNQFAKLPKKLAVVCGQ